MWVETDPYLFEEGEPIAVKFDQNEQLMHGTFESLWEPGDGDYLVYFTNTTGLKMSASHNRKFYRWVAVKPEDSVNVINESKLRLNKPDETAREVEQAEAALLKRIEKPSQVPEILIGDVVVDLKPGHHLRVWWEDGHLYTEIIQGETK